MTTYKNIVYITTTTTTNNNNNTKFIFNFNKLMDEMDG